MAGPHLFNRVTFHVPAERFVVRALITREERLPVVTEYVLRAVRTCRSLSVEGLKGFFGFSDHETQAVVSAMVQQGLLEFSGSSVALTAHANAQFHSADDEYPVFAKVEQVHDEIEFDLMSFTPLGRRGDSQRTDLAVDIRVDDHVVGHSVERAKEAYSERFAEISSRRQDYKRQRATVYSVQAVQSRGRFSVPISVELSLDATLQVNRTLPAGLAEKTSPEFEETFQSQLTSLVTAAESKVGGKLRRFIETFQLDWMSDYVKGSAFRLDRFIREVDADAVPRLPETEMPIYGQLYTETNRTRIVNRVEHYVSRWHEKRRARVDWLVPNDWMWGRDAQLAKFVADCEAIVHKPDRTQRFGHQLGWEFILRAESDDSEPTRQRLKRVAVGGHVRVVRPLVVSSPLAGDGRFEVCVFNGEFVAALCHVAIKGAPGIFFPVGFISAQRKQLAVAEELLREIGE